MPEVRSGAYSYYTTPLNSALVALAKHKQGPHPLGLDKVNLPLKQLRKGPGRHLYCPDPEQVRSMCNGSWTCLHSLVPDAADAMPAALCLVQLGVCISVIIHCTVHPALIVRVEPLQFPTAPVAAPAPAAPSKAGKAKAAKASAAAAQADLYIGCIDFKLDSQRTDTAAITKLCSLLAEGKVLASQMQLQQEPNYSSNQHNNIDITLAVATSVAEEVNMANIVRERAPSLYTK